jgi:hypothetical protein
MQKGRCSTVCSVGTLLGSTACDDRSSSFLTPWPENVLYPAADEVHFPEGITHSIVHDCDIDPDYKFLHETAIGVLDDELFVAWYQNPEHELKGKTFQRFRTSKDFGRTWSDHAVLMDRGNNQGLMYVGMQFLTLDGDLYAFTNQENGTERPVDCILLSWDKARRTWNEHGPVAERFLAMQQPLPMDNGNFVMSGSYAAIPGQVHATVPAVYISQGRNIDKPWRRVLLDSSDYVNVFAETAVVVDGSNLLAVTRLEKSLFPNVYESADFGESWRPVESRTFAACPSKFAAGKLSTGDRYIIYNLPRFQRDEENKILTEAVDRGRHTLVIALAGPRKTAFSRIWKLSDVTQSTKQKASHYPCAVEHRGMLYVTYTGQHERRNCGFTAIPVESLAK